VLTLPRELKREKELSKGGFWGKSPLCLLSSKIPPFVMMFPSAQDLGPGSAVVNNRCQSVSKLDLFTLQRRGKICARPACEPTVIVPPSSAARRIYAARRIAGDAAGEKGRKN